MLTDSNYSFGESSASRAFDAQVSLAAEDRGLFLVVSKRRSPRSAVESVGGQVVVELPGRTRVLAVLPVAMQPVLQNRKDIVLAGHVTIDPERFSRFISLVGLESRLKQE